MGIFDALTTAVTGMQAQSFALQNISGNIANSQTTAFKRIDSSFVDLIQDKQPSKQASGSVIAMSRSTNIVQGDIQSNSISTFMAINGDGYFVVEKPSGQTDNSPTFDGINQFTRRGDFQPNKEGYLVNGAGYYLMGIPVDAKTGNLTGSVPTLLKFKNDFLPAQATSEIDYRANLASYPLTPKHDSTVPGSELLNPVDFTANPLAISPQPAKITGTGATLLPDAVAKVTGTSVLPGTMVNGGSFTLNGATVTITAGMTPAQVLTAITTAVPPGLILPPTTDAGGHLVLNSTSATQAIVVGGANPTLLGELGLSVGAINPTNLLTQSAAAAGQTLTITVGSNPPLTVTFGTGGGEVATLAQLNTTLSTLTGGVASVNTTNGNVVVTASSPTDTIAVGGTVNPLTFGMHTTSALPSNQTVVANDLSTFVNESIGGGAVTAFDVSGSPVNIQVRWAKIDSASLGTGHADTWNLFYQTDSKASGNAVAWKNVGTNFTFGSNGQMDPVVSNLTINNVVVDGAALNNISMVFGSGGLTQFSDANGNVQVNLLQQNGFAAGSLQSISVSDKGRVVGAYSNGRTIDLAEITLAKFNGANFLKRIDGGAFEVTDESGAAIYGAAGKIVGSALERSNTDIADEFTKLIVTQQAYSANTRVITTSNQMVQDLLNMLR
jgi:flagellar hook protein FlgE